jgi:ascorbate-specific PTS system EIIC-type component UlaA
MRGTPKSGMDNVVKGILAVLVVAAFLVVGILMILGYMADVSQNKDIAFAFLMGMVFIAKEIISYYFGSSQESAERTKLEKEQVEVQKEEIRSRQNIVR